MEKDIPLNPISFKQVNEVIKQSSGPDWPILSLPTATIYCLHFPRRAILPLLSGGVLCHSQLCPNSGPYCKPVKFEIATRIQFLKSKPSAGTQEISAGLHSVRKKSHGFIFKEPGGLRLTMLLQFSIYQIIRLIITRRLWIVALSPTIPPHNFTVLRTGIFNHPIPFNPIAITKGDPADSVLSRSG